MNKKPENMTKAELIARVRELEKLAPVPDMPPEEALYRFLVAWYEIGDEHVGFCDVLDNNDPMYHVVGPNGDSWYNHARFATLEEVESAGFVLPVSGVTK